MLHRDCDAQRVDEFLSWLRGVLQALGDDCPALLVSGSIGLEPLVRRLGIPDRINHLHTVRLGPWDRWPLLVVALREHGGEEVRAPDEVRKVAADVRKAIKARAAAAVGQTPTAD